MGTGRWDDDSRWDQGQGRSPRSRRADDDVRQNRMGLRGGGAGGDRSARNGSRYPRRDGEDDWDNAGRGGSYGGRGRAGGSTRGDWDDPRGSGNRGGSGDRSARPARPPVRDDWDNRGRGGGGPGYSGSSRRPPQGGGLWGDADVGPRGRPGMGGVRNPRDPRSARGGRGAPEPEEGQFTFAKSAGIIASMFVLGVAVAFVIFMVTRPTPQIDNAPAVPTSTTAPELTPTVPNVTPSPTGLRPGAGPAYVVVVAGESGGV